MPGEILMALLTAHFVGFFVGALGCPPATVLFTDFKNAFISEFVGASDFPIIKPRSFCLRFRLPTSNRAVGIRQLKS